MADMHTNVKHVKKDQTNVIKKKNTKANETIYLHLKLQCMNQ